MRIIKLSNNDEDFETRADVDKYFQDKLPKRKPAGQFLLTKLAIGQTGISSGEKLVFTYNGKCVYKARAASTRKKNIGHVPNPGCVTANKRRKPFLVVSASAPVLRCRRDAKRVPL